VHIIIPSFFLRLTSLGSPAHRTISPNFNMAMAGTFHKHPSRPTGAVRIGVVGLTPTPHLLKNVQSITLLHSQSSPSSLSIWGGVLYFIITSASCIIRSAIYSSHLTMNTTSSSSRHQVVIYENSATNNEIVDFTTHHNNHNTTMMAPRFVTLAVSFRAIYTVYSTQGPWLGIVSAVLTAICVAPLFNFSTTGNGPIIPTSLPEGSFSIASVEAIPSTSTFTETTTFHELTISHNDDQHSTFGRMIQRIAETMNECIDDLNYVALVLLRENQGLLLLLIGGISTMALALVAGLDGVNGLKAVLTSINCYGVTTVLVARSARRIVNQTTALSQKPKLSSAEVTRIVEAIPEEKFVRNDDLGVCDWKCLTNMLHHRIASQSRECGDPGRSSSSCTEYKEYTPQHHHNPYSKKETLIAEIQQRRNYNDTCCICLSPFVREERIRVLPNCRHEFHQCCIDKWAQTFAADKGLGLRFDCNVKSGNPTCPLCKTCL